LQKIKEKGKEKLKIYCGVNEEEEEGKFGFGGLGVAHGRASTGMGGAKASGFCGLWFAFGREGPCQYRHGSCLGFWSQAQKKNFHFSPHFWTITYKTN